MMDGTAPVLPTIEEGAESLATMGQAEHLAATRERPELVRIRGTAKGQHTKQANKVRDIISRGGDPEAVRIERAILARDYDGAELLHSAVMLLTAEGDKMTEDGWLRSLSSVHQGVLQEIEDYLQQYYVPLVERIERDRRSSATGSSIRSTASKYMESERQLAAAELKLRQEQEEARIAEEEEVRIREMEAERRRIESERRQRQLQNELEEKRLGSQMLKDQLEATLPSDFVDRSTPEPSSTDQLAAISTPLYAPKPQGALSRFGRLLSSFTPGRSRPVDGIPINPAPRTTNPPVSTSRNGPAGVQSMSSSVAAPAPPAAPPPLTSISPAYWGARTNQPEAQVPVSSVSPAYFGARTNQPAAQVPVSSVSPALFGAQTIRAVAPAPPPAPPPLSVINPAYFGARIGQSGAAPAPSSSYDPALFGARTYQVTSRSGLRSFGDQGYALTSSVAQPSAPSIQRPAASINLSAAPAASMPSTSTGYVDRSALPGPRPSTLNPLAHDYTVGAASRDGADYVPAVSQAVVALGAHHTSYAAYGARTRDVAPPLADPRPHLDYLPSPDGWIDDLEGHRGGHLGYRSYHTLPKPKLPFFDGDPIAWPMFIQTFGAQVDRMCNDDSERLSLLRSCLSVEIQHELGALLHHPGLYPQCLRSLQQKYGNPRVIAAACSLALLNLQPIADDDFNALKNFSLSFRAAVATLLLGGFGAELESSATLALVVQKLPTGLRSKWAEYSYAIKDHLPHLIDLDHWIGERVMAEYCVRAGSESVLPLSAPPKPHHHDQRSKKQKPKTFVAISNEESAPAISTPTAAVTTVGAVVCAHCGRDHATKECRKFRELDVEKRAQLVKEKNLCFRCLGVGHSISSCSRKEKCGQDGCKSGHHRLLHNAPRMYVPKDGSKTKETVSSGGEKKEPPSSRTYTVTSTSASASGPKTMVCAADFKPEKVVLLPIVPVTIRYKKRKRNTFALLDTCSQVTMLCEAARAFLGLTGREEDARIGSWHNQDPSFRTQRIEFEVSSRDGSFKSVLSEVYSVQSLNLARRSVPYKKIAKMWPHLANIPMEGTDSAEVELLIGQDHGDLLEVLELRKDPLRQNAPRAKLTEFGWTITGDIGPAVRHQDIPRCNLISMALSTVGEGELAKAIDQFLFLDAYGAHPDAKPPVSREVQRCRQILQDTTKYLPEKGHYEAGVLWKSDEPELISNERGVMERFNRTMKRMKRNDALAKVVYKEMDENISFGFAVKLSKEEIAALPVGRTWYLPWHPVAHPHKPNKWRIVFDAAAEFNGASLNSKLYKGEINNVNLIGILIRFRQYPVALCADIFRMFHQVLVRPEDANIFLFYYQPAGAAHPQVYRMAVHIFGAICSPAVCAHVLRQSALDAAPDDVKLVLSQVDNHFYVDNWVSSFKTEAEASAAASAVTKALKKGGFELAEWGSSSKKVLRSLQGQPVSSVNLDLEALATERTLGLSLDFAADTFVVGAKSDVNCSTRRQLWSATASNYDPLGFAAPVLITGRMMLQRACKISPEWDAPLPPEIIKDWTEWTKSLSAINGLRIPRCYVKEEYTAVDLLMFSDASERAYGAIGYLRFEREDGTAHLSFVMARSKVAQLQYLSIPRLELNACLMSTRLANTIRKELQFEIRNVILCTDSTTNLRWFNSKDCRFVIYVANRVGEILESYDASHWRYVPTALNPADDISRGIPARELQPSHRHFHGPAYAQQPFSTWPLFPDLAVPLGSPPDPEIRSTGWTGVLTVEPSRIDILLSSIRPFSSIKKIVVFLLRWVKLYRQRKAAKLVSPMDPTATSATPQSTEDGPVFIVKKDITRKDGISIPEPSAAELQVALIRLVQMDQLRSFKEEFRALNKKKPLESSSLIAKVSPFVDETGRLRVGGRIERAPASFDTRHPIILPSKSKLTERIVHQVHLSTGHSSPWRTLPEIQREYWIPSPRRVIKRIVSNCSLCRRFSAKSMTPMMAALPASRLKPFQPPFAFTGVDYFGPIEVTLFRRKVKRWGCLFTCMTTRAVHFEMAYGLDADSFIAALQNFIVARGAPKIIHADNGTNFTASQRELGEALQRLDQSKIFSSLAQRGIEWRFNPPAAPHFGGSWERLVQSAKRALERVLHQQRFTDLSLSSALKQVEHLLNSRPLTYVTVDPAAPEPLTPYHILLGRPNPAIPPDVFTPSDLSCRKQWRVAQAVAESFWRRWMTEYLPSLTERRKWLRQDREPRVGDIVLVIDERTPRGQWPLGLVTEVCKGADGIVRSAFVRHRGTELERPAVKLCLLEPEEQEEDASV